MSECWCQEGYFIGTNKNQNWVIQISLCTLLKKEKKVLFGCTSKFTQHISSKVQENKLHFLNDSFYPDVLA